MLPSLPPSLLYLIFDYLISLYTFNEIFNFLTISKEFSNHLFDYLLIKIKLNYFYYQKKKNQYEFFYLPSINFNNSLLILFLRNLLLFISNIGCHCRFNLSV